MGARCSYVDVGDRFDCTKANFWDALVVTAAVLTCAFFTVCVVPGLLLFAVVKPMHTVDPLVLVASACGVSLGIIQALTIVSLLLHINSFVMVYAFLIAICLFLVGLCLAPKQGIDVPAVRIDLMQAVIIAFLAAVLAAAYLIGNGSYLNHVENLTHIAVVERLAGLSRPAIDNVFFVPNFIYTYVFPGTHFFMALVHHLTGLDPIIVFDRARVYWALIALTSLYAATYAIFRSALIASTTILVALVLWQPDNSQTAPLALALSGVSCSRQVMPPTSQ